MPRPRHPAARAAGPAHPQDMSVERVPVGVPTGGQFAACHRAESGVSLSGGDPVLGDPVLVELDETYHVGTLAPGHRKALSYEGEGLSVSVHPEDWSQIARLGGAPTWVLRRPDGQPLRFVSWHDLDEVTRDRVRDWGAERGWVEQRQVWMASYYDEEWDGRASFSCATEEAAHAEVEDYEDHDAAVESVLVWRPTTTFPDARISADDEPSDVLLAAYLREQRPDLDGVWWEDDYDPDRLSCPRGVLVGDPERYERRTC